MTPIGLKWMLYSIDSCHNSYDMSQIYTIPTVIHLFSPFYKEPKQSLKMKYDDIIFFLGKHISEISKRRLQPNHIFYGSLGHGLLLLGLIKTDKSWLTNEQLQIKEWLSA